MRKGAMLEMLLVLVAVVGAVTIGLLIALGAIQGVRLLSAMDIFQ